MTSKDLSSKTGSISIENVSKSFQRSGITKNSYSTIKSKLLEFCKLKKTSGIQDNNSNSKFFALDNINIDIPAGSSIALVGRNGSGKSTLLKLLAGIYIPDSGKVTTLGSVSALIELGAGFHPDFSGRENIFLGGIMFGLTKHEIMERFDKIVSYAELEDVIDQPVRTYSSGMYMRLGFSLAIHTDPDILLIDEVLAVGDAHFIHKCQDSISEFKRKGKTLVFVTHDLSSVSRWCDEAIWLEHGKIKMRGHPREITDYYLLSIRDQENKELESEDNLAQLIGLETSKDDTPSLPWELTSKRWGNKNAELTSVKLINTKLEETWTFGKDDSLTVKANFKLNKNTDDLVFGVGIIRIDGLEVFGTNTGFHEETKKLVKLQVLDKNLKEGVVCFTMPRLGLSEGTYFLDIACHAEDGTPYDYHHRIHKFHVRTNSRTHGIIEPIFKWGFNE